MSLPETNCESLLQNLQAEYEEFAYIVSHDMKAPVRGIANIIGWLEEDLAGTLPAESQENFKMLQNRLVRLEKMIEALLQFSRVSRQNLHIANCNIETEIRNLLTQLDPEKQVALAISGHLAPFPTYAGKLSQVLNEVLKNAIIFNQKTQPQVLVTLTETPAFFNIRIRDNGPGVPLTSLERIFTIFYTVQPKDTVNTTGAGLAIANKITNFVGGRISAANHPEGGLEITLEWPKKPN